MNVKRLQISNFRGFRDVAMEFHPRFNLIVGINGTGKTAVLEALRIMLGSIFLRVDKVEDKISSPGIAGDDVRLSANLEQQYPVVLGASADLPEFENGIDRTLPEMQEIYWERSLEQYGGRTTTKGARKMIEVSEAMQKVVRSEGSPSTIPLVAYFSTERFKKERRDIGLEKAGSRLRGYFNALNSMSNVKYFLDLWFTETLWELQNSEASGALEAVKEALKRCINDCSDAYFDLKMNELVMVRNSDGSSLPYHMLSDGVRSMFAMVMEIAFRAHLLNPHLGKDAARLTPGTILIDEIDLHLHPEWQMRVVDDLQRTFPEMQFIASTHAPLVVGSMAQGKIISIDNGEIFDFSLQYGRDANYILNEMGATEMPPQLKENLDRYFALIQSGHGRDSQALALRENLAQILGDTHPELGRADLMLTLFS